MTPKLCHFCPCRIYDDDETGCPKGLHATHAMEPLGNGYWFCPRHDTPGA